MQICPVVKLFSDDDDSRATGRNWKDRKRDAIISLTQNMDVIQVCPSHSKEDWWQATKMKSGWLVTGGLEFQMISTTNLEENKWIINLEYKTYDDQATRDWQRHVDQRRRNKREKALKDLATIVEKKTSRYDEKIVH